MTATATEKRPVSGQDAALWTIWAEGYAATGESETAWQLNEMPIQAESLDDAVRQYSQGSDSRHLFERRPDGSWKYWGCRLFDSESDARGAYG